MDNFLQDFDRSLIKRTDVYLSGEEGFYEAYKNHLNVSKVLRDQNNDELLIVAYSELLVSVECFLKDMFCIVRYEMVHKRGGISPLMEPTLINFLGEKSIELISKTLSTKERFQHDLIKLCKFLESCFEKLKTSPNYQSFVTSLPTDSRWIEVRYKNPTLLKKSHDKKEFDRLYNSFELVIKNELGKFI